MEVYFPDLEVFVELAKSLTKKSGNLGDDMKDQEIYRLKKLILKANLRCSVLIMHGSFSFFVSFSLCVSCLAFFDSSLFMWDFRVATLNVNRVRDELKRASLYKLMELKKVDADDSGDKQ